MTASATIDHQKLTKADRCDQGACNAAAGVRAVLPKGGELLFCAHHLQVNRVRLDEIGATFHA